MVNLLGLSERILAVDHLIQKVLPRLDGLAVVVSSQSLADQLVGGIS
jgi:hypothetical protein